MANLGLPLDLVVELLCLEQFATLFSESLDEFFILASEGILLNRQVWNLW